MSTSILQSGCSSYTIATPRNRSSLLPGVSPRFSTVQPMPAALWVVAGATGRFTFLRCCLKGGIRSSSSQIYETGYSQFLPYLILSLPFRRWLSTLANNPDGVDEDTTKAKILSVFSWFQARVARPVAMKVSVSE